MHENARRTTPAGRLDDLERGAAAVGILKNAFYWWAQMPSRHQSGRRIQWRCGAKIHDMLDVMDDAEGTKKPAIAVRKDERGRIGFSSRTGARAPSFAMYHSCSKPFICSCAHHRSCSCNHVRLVHASLSCSFCSCTMQPCMFMQPCLRSIKSKLQTIQRDRRWNCMM